MVFCSASKKILRLVLSILIVALSGSGAALAQPPQVQHANGVTFVSGGVGDESMAQLAEMEKQFDLKLFLVGQSGAYLSDIGITITDAKGKGVLLTTSEGPVLLANLPSGAYAIKASKNGDTLEQKVSVSLGQLRTLYLRFPNE